MRARFVHRLGATLLAIAGCGGETASPGTSTTTTEGPPPVTVAAGDFAIRISPGGRDLELVHGATTLVDFPSDSLQLGVLPAVDDQTNYDPHAIVAPNPLHPAPQGLEWLSPEAFAVQDASASPLVVSLSYPRGKRATLRVEPRGAGSFALHLAPDGALAGDVAYFRLRPRVDEKEGLYGLGESFDDVNQRGKVRAMQIEIDATFESTYNNAHVPIPFLLGTRGWGLFVESARPGVFSVAVETSPGQPSDLVEAIFGTGTASADGLTFHLFGEQHPLDLTRHYYDVTGYPRLPARWALGPWIWRNESADQAQAEGDLQAMRDLDLPATGYWVDRPYATAVNTFDWSANQFPAPQQLIDRAHDLGFGVALWHVPYLDEKAPEVSALRDEAVAKGYYPPVTSIALNPWGKPLDLTNPEAYAWWQSHVEAYTSMGVEGFKLDYAEDVVPGITSARNVWEFADGSDERTMHGRYQLFYHRAYQDLLPEDGGFLLCRHGTFGDQQNVSVIWPGDLDASFAKNGEKVVDGSDTYKAVGGLPASIVAGLSLGASGFPFFGADTGGYLHQAPDKELFTRWFEQTALSTVMQIGNGSSTVAWEPDAVTGFDAEMLEWYRTYTRLHLRLFPYEWTYAKNIAVDGRPIARPLGLAYPELGAHPSDTYLFGDHLLVAPVVERGATSRPVLLPPGRWVDWWTGEIVEGGGTITADAPLGKLPLWLREGGIVPMLRPTIDTLRPTTDPAHVDSYATDAGVLWARLAAGAKASFTVFDGAEITAERLADRVELGTKDGAEFVKGTELEVIAFGAKPASVSDGGSALVELGSLAELDAAPEGWAFVAAAGGTVYVKTGAGTHAVRIAF